MPATSVLLPARRSTRQNHAIRAVLAAAGRPLLPTEILLAAQVAVPSLGLATVYRNIKQLMEDGDVHIVELPGDPPRYELAGKHHHHFHCQGCDRVFDIHACPGDLQTLAPRGFTVADHDLTLYGTCPECQPAPVPGSPSAVRNTSQPAAGASHAAGCEHHPECGHIPHGRAAS